MTWVIWVMLSPPVQLVGFLAFGYAPVFARPAGLHVVAPVLKIGEQFLVVDWYRFRPCSKDNGTQPFADLDAIAREQSAEPAVEATVSSGETATGGADIAGICFVRMIREQAGQGFNTGIANTSHPRQQWPGAGKLGRAQRAAQIAHRTPVVLELA